MLKSSKRLKHISPLLYAFERLFALFSLLSLADLLFGPREDFDRTRTSVQKVRVTVHRGRQIEAYVVIWLVVEIACAIFVSNNPAFVPWLFRCVFAYRIFEAMQAQLNLNVFSSLRTHGRPPRVASLARTVVLSLLNFLELMLCFGAIYSSDSSLLKDAAAWYDPYYLSVMTQMTVGYGDISPLGGLRAVAAAQAICGFILAVIVIGRLVAFLPKTEPILRGR
jgi:hypothetical protein